MCAFWLPFGGREHLTSYGVAPTGGQSRRQRAGGAATVPGVLIDVRQTWQSEAWRTEVVEWMSAELAALGIDVVGPVEQVRVRMWSTQLTVPTSDGKLWFKENHPGQLAEAAVVEVLAGIAPEYVVVPVAVERSRGWLLSHDQGPTLATLQQAPDEETAARVVADFARLQRRVAGRETALTDAGLVRMLPSETPELVARRVDQMRAAPADSAVHIDAELAERALAALPALAATAERLAELAPPLASLEHNDLHHNNVFVPDAGDAPLRFFDFGDGFWAHPFTSLRVPVGSLCRDLDTDPADPRVRRVVDAYLAVWSDLAELPVLREMASLAQVFGTVHRFESWRRLLDRTSLAMCPDDAEAVQHWLGQVAATPYPRS